MRNWLSCRRKIKPLSASHSLAAEATNVASTDKVERRPADDFEHFGGRRLLLQGFGEIGCALGEVGRALAQFAQQPRVLNGDDGLISKGRHQLDLTGSKRTHRVSYQCNYTDWCSISQKRNAQGGASFSKLLKVQCVFGILADITDVNDLSSSKVRPTHDPYRA